MKKIVCQTCGTKLSKETNFCPNCGASKTIRKAFDPTTIADKQYAAQGKQLIKARKSAVRQKFFCSLFCAGLLCMFLFFPFFQCSYQRTAEELESYNIAQELHKDEEVYFDPTIKENFSLYFDSNYCELIEYDDTGCPFITYTYSQLVNDSINTIVNYLKINSNTTMSVEQKAAINSQVLDGLSLNSDSSINYQKEIGKYNQARILMCYNQSKKDAAPDNQYKLNLVTYSLIMFSISFFIIISLMFAVLKCFLSSLREMLNQKRLLKRKVKAGTKSFSFILFTFLGFYIYQTLFCPANLTLNFTYVYLVAFIAIISLMLQHNCNSNIRKILHE